MLCVVCELYGVQLRMGGAACGLRGQTVVWIAWVVGSLVENGCGGGMVLR
jgi:hypothetical protein